MTAEELMKRFSLREHIENGAFVERHYENTAPGRAASGAIYYYVAADEVTEFHRIDCDEYWCFNAGSDLEVWQVDENGALTVSRLGIGEGCEPLVYLRSGVIFASKHADGCREGTFLTCITVPRFTYQGFELLPKETMTEQYPQTARFYTIAAK